jgi:hypothetical protein
MSRADDQDRGPDGESAETGFQPIDQKASGTDGYETLRETLEAILAGMSMVPPEKLRS